MGVCDCIVEVEAVVEKGLGEGAYYVELYSSRFLESLGFKPYPGTLNARVAGELDALRECLARGEPLVVPPPPGRHDLKPVLAYPAWLKGSREVEVYLVKPLASKHGDRVLELVSSVSLRETLGLRDGDVVVVRVCCGGWRGCSGGSAASRS